MNQENRSFHDLSEQLKEIYLLRRKDYGKCERKIDACFSHSGGIYVFNNPSVSPSRVCVKIPKISRHIDAKEASRRFLREMKIQRSLYYHMFVHWPFEFDFIIDTPIAWFRYWYYDLSQLIEKREFSVIGRIAMLVYIAEGMIHCHKKGLIAHQDFKPENIFVRNCREDFRDLPDVDVYLIPKIADFGSANLASEINEYGGTRPYKSPEQWNKGILSYKSTVWSLGLIAYEFFSYGVHPIGEKSRPWRNKEKGVFDRWQDDAMWEEWILQGDGMPRIPLQNEALNQLVAACMNKEPSKRPSLVAVRDQFLEILKSESSEAYECASLLISHANSQPVGDHNWPYLDERYNHVVQESNTHFGIS